MKIFLLTCVGLSVIGWSTCTPTGVGAYSIQDPYGNRYEGTYHIRDDGQAVNDKGEPVDVPRFPIPDFDSFYPEFFKNFENSLDEVFDDNFESQQKAFDAARRAFEMISEGASYIHGSIPRWGNMMDNSAVAIGVVSPTNTRQVAAISPQNPNMPNVNVMRSYQPPSGPGVYSVSSQSSSSSMNVGGREVSNRFAKTVVNRNGDITTYEVHN